jgi:hypothetical protein
MAAHISNSNNTSSTLSTKTTVYPWDVSSSNLGGGRPNFSSTKSRISSTHSHSNSHRTNSQSNISLNYSVEKSKALYLQRIPRLFSRKKNSFLLCV